MRPTRPRDLSKPNSKLEFYSDDFHPKAVEQSIAALREENEKLRWMATLLEGQTRLMRATAEKSGSESPSLGEAEPG
jgi:hypothetical protein